ncbi:MAG: hypothetical protein GYB36_00165 [Alphaproteobacteria bacterium]|nr:hypothetical protein [Alphaproteobacteria bacterium]
MSSGGPWSVKGIDPRARARAKSAARREGLTLGEWLNRVILDDGENPDLPAQDWDDALEAFPGFSETSGAANDVDDRLIRAMITRLSTRIEESEEASQKTLSDLDRAISQLASNIVKSTQKQSEKLNAADQQFADVKRSQSELAARLRSLESETGGSSPDQVKAIETTLMKLARRVYEHENETNARLHDQDELGREAFRQSETRLDQLEARTEKLADLAERLDTSGRGNDDTARTLETAFARLDERLRALENRNASDNVDLERRFDRLSDDVAKVIADTRAQVGQTAGRVDDAERRQADSLARLGDDISRLAQAIDTRLSDSERRAEEARRDRRSEEALNTRIDEVRQENRDSMRRMGEEVTRLGRSLADRIDRTEKRAASAVADASQRVSDAVERIEKAAPAREEDLESRLRASEERTAQRIEDALSGVQENITSIRAEAEEAMTPVQRAMTALADRLEAIEKKTEPEATPAEPIVNPAPAPISAPVSASVAQPVDLSQPLGPPPQAEVPASHFDAGKEDPFLAAPSASTPQPASPAQAPIEAPVLREPQAPASPPPTRRKARRAAAAARKEADQTQTAPQQRPQPKRPPARAGATADSDFLAAARDRTRSSYDPSVYDRPQGQTKFSRATLIAIPLAALIMLGGAGAILLWEAVQGSDTTSIAASGDEVDFVAQFEADLAVSEAPAEAPAPVEAQPDQTAVATPDTPQPDASQAPARPPANMVADASGAITPAPVNSAPAETQANTGSASANPFAERTTLQSAAADGDPVARYQLGVQQLEAGDARSAAILLRRAAEQGVPDAQYRFAKLLETGEGVDIDLEAARRWTERAANAGHRRAMHNLAVMYYYGSGAERDFETAARWFQDAALLGLRDSQFNLALLFESGQGVPLSLPDAYAWYMISASENDPTAIQRAQALESTIEPAALEQARQVVAGFSPRPLDAEANGLYQDQAWDRTTSTAAADVERVQGFLSVLGYNPGPIDGDMGDLTRTAIMAFEADQGLPRTGRVDAVLMERLESAVNG